MRMVRTVALAGAVILVGATAGFVAALLRPRHYAEFVGTREDVTGLSAR